jgi:DNA-binding transcriptional ArsR family regulator
LPKAPRARSGASAARAFLGSAPLFAALGDETRLRLVSRLCNEGPQSISRLTENAGAEVTRQAITKHLRLMHDVGLVKETRQGRESIWQLETRQIELASGYLDQISQQWDEALVRLKAFVED